MDRIVRLKEAYRALPPGRRVSPRLEDLAARVANRLFGRASTAPARALEEKLLAGHAAAAAADLAALGADPRAHPRRAAAAHWALARWRADRGEPAAALAALAAMRARAPRLYPESRLVEADCLIRLGRAAEARALLGGLATPDAALLAAAAENAAANAAGDEAGRRAALAAAFAAAFAPVGGFDLDPARPLGLDTLDPPWPEEEPGAAGGPDPAPAAPAPPAPELPAPELPAPEISVIVPVHLHWDLAGRLLAALAAQTLAPERFEAVFVNNGGPLPAPAPALPPGAGFGFRLLDCPAPGAYAARNAGAAAARGALLVFTDADCVPVPGWLAAFAAAAAAAPGRLLAGPVRMAPPAPAAAKEAAAEEAAAGRPNPFAAYDRLRGIPQERYVRLGYAATANLTVPRALFEAQGGFDARRFSGGDAEFCRRAGRAGAAIALAPAAEVAHPVRADWAALAIKARRVKGGQIRGGAPGARALWLVRTLTPPLRASARFLRAPAPWPERRAALGVLYRLWGVELAETARLLAGGAPERR